MATADDDAIIIDGDGEFIVEEDEGASIPVVEVYEAYANAVGEASANARDVPARGAAGVRARRR